MTGSLVVVGILLLSLVGEYFSHREVLADTDTTTPFNVADGCYYGDDV